MTDLDLNFHGRWISVGTRLVWALNVAQGLADLEQHPIVVRERRQRETLRLYRVDHEPAEEGQHGRAHHVRTGIGCTARCD